MWGLCGFSVLIKWDEETQRGNNPYMPSSACMWELGEEVEWRKAETWGWQKEEGEGGQRGTWGGMHGEFCPRQWNSQCSHIPCDSSILISFLPISSMLLFFFFTYLYFHFLSCPISSSPVHFSLPHHFVFSFHVFISWNFSSPLHVPFRLSFSHLPFPFLTSHLPHFLLSSSLLSSPLLFCSHPIFFLFDFFVAPPVSLTTFPLHLHPFTSFLCSFFTSPSVVPFISEVEPGIFHCQLLALLTI